MLPEDGDSAEIPGVDMEEDYVMSDMDVREDDFDITPPDELAEPIATDPDWEIVDTTTTDPAPETVPKPTAATEAQKECGGQLGRLSSLSGKYPARLVRNNHVPLLS